jgi:hypothetical protein
MCGICEAEGLARECEECGGYEWVVECGDWESFEGRMTLLAGLCGDCKRAWLEKFCSTPSSECLNAENGKHKWSAGQCSRCGDWSR